MATEQYIPVTGDDWYERRREDVEGEFFRKVADQGPRKGLDGSTRQGIYCLTAGGKLLAFRNGQDAESVRTLLKKGLTEWAGLSEAERKAAPPKVKDTQPADPEFCRIPPAAGLVVNVYTRMLRLDDKGKLQDSGLRGGEHDLAFGAGRDHLWLTRDEWRTLIPRDARKGDEFPVPAAIAERILRFHLIDNTRGEPPMWTKKEVREAHLKLLVTRADATILSLRLTGDFALATDKPPLAKTRAFDGSMLGYIDIDRKKGAITRFDVVALGDHQGQGLFTGGARPGRTPLGVCFELAKGSSCADNVPPQGARDSKSYFDTGR